MSPYRAQQRRRLRVITTGGGTGGHTYPALTTITTLRNHLEATGTAPELLWVGVRNGLEATIAERAGIPFRAITTGRLRRSPNPASWYATSPTPSASRSVSSRPR